MYSFSIYYSGFPRSDATVYFNICDLARGEDLSRQRARYFRFINDLAPAQLCPNPLPLLQRAINAVKLACVRINQPRWRRGRWKSKS